MAIRSMTGFGQAAADLEATRLRVELRTVNHRYADVRLRLPAALAAREADLRRKILAQVQRGRVEVSVSVEALGGGEPAPQLNEPLWAAVLDAARRLRTELGSEGQADPATLLTVPGLFRSSSPDSVWDDTTQGALDQVLDDALDALNQDRTREGRHLAEEMLGRIAEMKRIASEVATLASRQPAEIRQRLVDRLRELEDEVQLDPARVAQEAALLADRADITEETVRLEAHLAQAETLLASPDEQPLGKRMDFLLQEINRETNTINSKSSDLELSRRALALKAEVEKVREQTQNLE